MNQPKRRQWWLDIATPYGDPCDFIDTKPHAHPSATNIPVIELLPGDIIISRAELREQLPCRCNNGYAIRGMVDPNCLIHDLEFNLFGPESTPEGTQTSE